MAEGVITAIIVVAILAYLYMSKTKKYDTMVRIAELGENVDEKLIAALQKEQGNYKNDYKLSLLWTAIGIPTCMAMWDSGVGADRAWGLIPLFIGIAYFISGRLRLRDTVSEP